MTELAARVLTAIQPLRLRTLVEDAVVDGQRRVHVETLVPEAAIRVVEVLAPLFRCQIAVEEPCRVLVWA